MTIKRRKFRADYIRELRYAYYAEERQCQAVAKTLQGMGWRVEECEPTTRPVVDADFLRTIFLTAWETGDDNSASISVEWQTDKVLISVLSDPDTHMYSEELDVADDENGTNDSGSVEAVLRMVRDAVAKVGAL